MSLAERMIGQARQQMVQRVVAQADRRPERRQRRRAAAR